ncbi:DegT/DnrJ/EryC1/StrS family aminotransferase [Candidatus Woesearchaeota archaeon]|nr:DegT/DnrJ/EryC1/StrS family aminotransferase [Candidatus Woesearchaeota archaeon]
MDVKFVDLKAQYNGIKKEIDSAIREIVENTSFIMGQPLKQFEENFAQYCNSRFAVGVSSGTSALHQALLAAGVQRGDEVITVPHTFMATVEAIFQAGAKPVFVDVKDDGLMDIEEIGGAITEKTKAILPVHLYGKPVDVTKIRKISDENERGNDIRIIEDCAQAHGAELNGEKVPIGEVGCFSFYPGKNLGGYGDGGAVVTDDEKIAEKAAMMRDHGRTSKYEHMKIGFNERMDAMQAAILNVKLKFLDEWTEKRIAHAKLYNKELKGVVNTPEITEDKRHVFHLYTIQTERRDELQGFLKENGISTGVHYPIPLHLQPALKELGYKKGDFPETERLADSVLSLPMYAELSDEKISYVCKKIKEFFGG